MKSIVTDPLIHFLLLGAGLFVLFQLTGGGVDSQRVVTVDREALLTFLQYRSTAFDRAYFEEFLDTADREELDVVISQFVREETMYREALALELDKDDYNIRERLVQKLQFLAEGFQSTNVEITDQEIEDHFFANVDRYYVDPRITFTHVYFSAAERGLDEALRLAENKLVELNSAGVSFEEAVAHGDPFPYFVNYVEHTPELVTSHLGAQLTETLFRLSPDDSTWQGPFQSPYGAHVVMVLRVQEGRQRALEEIADRVREDLRAERLRELTEAALDDIAAGYDIEVSADLRAITTAAPEREP